MKTYLKLYYDSMWGGVGSSALSGAGIGTTILPGWGTAIGGLVGAGVGLFTGLSQRKQGNQLLGANQFQPNQVPQTQLYNEQLARQQASEGLPSQQYQQNAKDIKNQQQTFLRAAGDRRSANQLIPALQQNSNNAFGRLDAQSAMMRTANEGRLIGVNTQGSALRNQMWQLNERNRMQQYNYGQQLIGAGNENIVHGVDSGVAALMRGGGGLYGSGQGDNSNVYGNIGSNSYNNPNITSVAETTPNVQGSGLTPLQLTYNQ